MDRTPPNINVPPDIGTNFCFEKQTNITINIKDMHLDKFYYRYGEQEYIQISSSESLTLCFTKSGEYLIRIKARDFAGNERLLDLQYIFDISLVDTQGFSADAKNFVKKIIDVPTAKIFSDIKDRETGINVLEYMIGHSKNAKSTAATIVSRRDDKVLIILRHENGILTSQTRSIIVYDRVGMIIKRIDTASCKGAVATWNKTDNNGARVRDGIYIMVIEYAAGKDYIPVIVMNSVR